MLRAGVMGGASRTRGAVWLPASALLWSAHLNEAHLPALSWSSQLSQDFLPVEHPSCPNDSPLFPATSLSSSPSAEGEAGSVLDLSAWSSDGNSLIPYHLGLDVNGEGQLMTSTGWPLLTLDFPREKHSFCHSTC